MLLVNYKMIQNESFYLILVFRQKNISQKITMSQHNSSVLSSGVQNGMQSSMQNSLQNSQAKYQKALKQISKLIATNKNLKNQCEERQQILGAQLSDVAMRFEQLSKKYDQVQMQKRKMQQYIQELQDTNQDLRKQYQTMQRQVGYLNDVLTQQNAQLKKLSVFKDQKGISQLLKSYEQRQNIYKKDISRLEDNISNLKITIDRLQQDLTQQTQMRQRYQDQYNIVGLQINKYRDLNNYLMNQNEHILNQAHKDNGFNKHQQLQSVVFDFKRQLQNLRNIKYEAEDVSEKQYVKNYQLLLEEKNHLAIELAKTRDQLEITQTRVKQMYDIEERMSTAAARSDILIGENNMLKNRITLLESKQIIDSAGFDQDSELKDFQDKINFMMSKSDPLQTIKNSDDNTHFVAMKSIITDLQSKLQSVIEKKQIIERKYKSIKMKFSKKAQQSIILDDSNKLLKGKLQGYQRLTQKLHYQLQRSMHAHEDQIVKMVAITNNLVGRKVTQSKTASAFLKSQFDIQIQKADRVEKTLAQQLQALKLQNNIQRIKLSDLQQKQKLSIQFIQIYQSKLTELSSRYKQLQEENTTVNQSLLKFEQLYREQKTRHQTILIQKQNISSKLSSLSEQIKQRTYKWQQQTKMRQQNYSNQIKRARIDTQRFKQQIQALRIQNKRLTTQLNDRRVKQNSSLVSIKTENHYYTELQRNYTQLKQSNHSLENQLISLNHKLTNYENINHQLSQLETQVMKKNDELNDQRRAIIMVRKEVEELQQQNNDLKEHNQQLGREIQSLTSKIYQEPSHHTTTKGSSSKEVQSRKTIQRLNEEITILQSTVRDQKIKSNKVLMQIKTLQDQIERLQEIITRNKSREQSLLNTISQAHEELSQSQDQLLEIKSRYTHNLNSTKSLNQSLEQTNKKINSLNQQLSIVKAKQTKAESKYDNVIRQILGVKYTVQQVQKMIKRLNSAQRLQYEQQRQKQNLSSLVDSLNRIIKNSETNQLSSSGSNLEYNFIPASSFGNLQTNNYGHGSSQLSTKINFGGSFGTEDHSKNNLITNDSFRGYQGSSSFQSSGNNVNYSSDDFNRANIGGSSFNSFNQHHYA